ncbi:hypothetical protein UVI_02062220 [Ustilaginoidea virens]|uniref:alpha-1,2-Mannosidase n=1 Tax=Ustilaginoidea virens TaxID=1159556 RepID=A0A1B5L7C6_USTVR|nr:hypothetical protein UVI_02062220 [Ustilaginoidea virens]
MRRRRNKLFTFCAAVIVILLYRVLQNSWQGQRLGRTDPRQPLVVPVRSEDRHEERPQPPPTTEQLPQKNAGKQKPKIDHVAQKAANDEILGTTTPATQTGGDRTSKGASHRDAPADRTSVGGVAGFNPEPKTDTEEVNANQVEAHLKEPIQRLGTSNAIPTSTSTSASARSSPTTPKEHWIRPKEHFPLPKESIITLPTGSRKKIPKIQHVFSPEAEGPKKKRLQRQAMVKQEIRRSWAGYRKYAWMHDELLPVTNRSRDPFCGWAATLVDSLDTLWIAGLKAEFDEAARAAETIDFTYTERSEIPVFETTIRYLGGLVAAYDVSGGASGSYSFLLDKAVELAEILMGIFDTPNRMPILYYEWQPESTSRPRRARRVGIAELGTLSLEFTRLAQVTGQHKYYDAVDRITNGLVELQKKGTLIPGLFPENLDVSGCNKTAAVGRSWRAAQNRASSADTLHDLKESRGRSSIMMPTDDDRLERRASSLSQQREIDAALVDAIRGESRSRPKFQVPLVDDGTDDELDCAPQGIEPGMIGYQKYHVGGGQDSAYEYFGKEYLLLGGKEGKYQKLYEDTVEGINKNLLFRPMVPGDWDILFPAKVGVSPSTRDQPNPEYEVTHLTCFVGGMYALGGKLFGREEDLNYAEKLTNGCVWAYQSTATGIMPEHGTVVPCPTLAKCAFNETVWWRELDPYYGSREGEAVYGGKSGAELDDLDTEQTGVSKAVKPLAAETSQAVHESGGPAAASASTSTDYLSKRAVIPDGSVNQRGSSSGFSPEDELVLNTKGKTRKAKQHDSEFSNEREAEYPGRKDKDAEKHGSGFSTEAEVGNPELNDKDLNQYDSEVSTETDAKYPKLKGKDAYRLRSRPSTIPEYRPGQARTSETRAKTPLNSHREYVQQQIKDGVPPGFSGVLRTKPEAIESVWYMYRITGDPSWMDKGWTMFEATMKATRTSTANSAIYNVLSKRSSVTNEMESFWLAETLKYYYLLFSGPDVISLDEWVLNTEAHPFKL